MAAGRGAAGHHRDREVRGGTGLPPVPLDGWPKDLARLQVSGTDLDDPEPPADADPTAPVLWLNPELDMSAGKTMAQTGHGAQLAWWELSDDDRTAWRRAGFPLSVRTATPAHWAELISTERPLVRDAGFTEIARDSLSRSRGTTASVIWLVRTHRRSTEVAPVRRR